jgi:prevent-host-death family protein
MKIASVADVKARFSTFLRAAEGGPVVVTRNGRAVAVLIGIDDEEEIERLLMAYSPRLRAILDVLRRQIREGRGIAHETFWSQIEVPRSSRRREGAKSKKA